jgi:predicted CoA-substrate-specific enzyme activase
MMITAGIDAGTDNMKVLLLGDNTVLASAVIPLGIRPVHLVARYALEEVAEKAGLAANEIVRVAATGIGSEYITFAQDRVSEAVCCARGASWLMPNARTVIDLGSDKCLIVKCQDGVIGKSIRNDRCASGTGRFLQIAANPLGMDAEEMGNISLQSQKDIEINDKCAVFAESEIISLIHLQHRPEDIAKAVLRGLARRIYTLLIKVGLEPELVMVGGVANNKGMVKALEEQIGHPVLVPNKPMVVGALGGALVAAQRQKV